MLNPDRKLDKHVESAVKRREPNTQELVRKYNKLCRDISAEIDAGRAPPGAIAPPEIDGAGLWALDVDDEIWQDVGLDDSEDADNPPGWLGDDDVRDGIKAMLQLDRCAEEEWRSGQERRSMQEWFAEEWRALTRAFDETGMFLFIYFIFHFNLRLQMMNLFAISFNFAVMRCAQCVAHG